MSFFRYVRNFFGHLSVVTKHKWRVFINCYRCGIPFRGIIHDLSKFSPTEFFESVRYFQGNRSPIGACRRATGKSYAWLHHKGRNKHHMEYWLDGECKEHPLMPYKYAVECMCDKLAATRVYAGKNYSRDLPLLHWNKYGCKVACNPRTLAFAEQVFRDVEIHGEKFVLNKRYMKKTYEKICIDGNNC